MTDNNTEEAGVSAEAKTATVDDLNPLPIETVHQDAMQKTDNSSAQPLCDINKIDILNDVYIALSIEVGRTHIKIRDLLSLSKGSVIELDKLAGEPVDIYANGKLISRGNIITANGKYCVRLMSPTELSKQEA